MIKKFFNKPLIIISFVCYVILTILIFALSLTNGKDSSAQSSFVWSFISSILDVKGDYEFLIRKIVGHFLLFGALALHASVVYYRLSQTIFSDKVLVYSTIITLLVGFVTALISEFLQLSLFVEGRTASLFDIFIDFLGFIFGYLAFIIFKSIYNKKKKLPVV